MKLTNSLNLKARAEALIPDQTQTASKAARRFVQGVAPVYLERGEGAYVWDVDGNCYLDLTMALLPIVLGYSDLDVNRVVKEQVDKGVLFTLPGPLEVEVAEELLQYWVPWASHVRFFKTGSEATSAAIRLARAVTGRDKIAVVQPGYHGWHDWFIACQPPALGVPESAKGDIRVVERHNTAQLHEVLRNPSAPIAGLIMEPLSLARLDPADSVTKFMSETASHFLREARRVCDETGTLLILDEVVSGIRANPTVASWVPIQPDLMTLAKAVANGYPLAVLVGRDPMKMLNQDEVFVSGTYGGDLVSLAAAKATLLKLRSPMSPPATTDLSVLSCEDGTVNRSRIDTQMTGGEAAQHGVRTPLMEIWEWGSRLLRMVESVSPPGVDVLGTPMLFVLRFQNRHMADFWQQECMKRGVLFTGNHNIALAHCNNQVMDTLQRVYEEVTTVVKSVAASGQNFADVLEGEPTRPAFSKGKRH